MTDSSFVYHVMRIRHLVLTLSALALASAAAAQSPFLAVLTPLQLAAQPGLPTAQRPTPSLERYLRTVGIDTRQLADARAGRPVVKLLPVKNERDVAVFGLIGVNAPRDSVVARILDVERFLGANGPSRFHVFGSPPSAADVRDVAFDETEYRDLRKCEKGSCDFKFPAWAMDVFVKQVNWSARDAKAQADDRLRTGLLQLATDYTARGNAAMLVFDDVRGVRASDVFSDLLVQSPDLYEYAPELQRYLASYPAARPAGARDFLYWAEDRMPRMRPTLTFNHLVVYTPPSLAQVTLVARKQIHANHYFEGAFELLAVIDATTAPNSPGTYVLTVRRYRFDNLPGGLLNIRGKVQQQLVDAARAELERQRSTLQTGARRG